jgi:hypothetical protein
VGKFDNKVRLLTGLIPKTEVHDEDVFIIGFQKSGTNWFRNLVAGVVYGADPEFAPYSLLRDLIPNRVPKQPYYKRYATPTYFKVHDLPRREFNRVVYILRDGRDVMVSYYHHLRAIKGDVVDFMKVVKADCEVTSGVKWHVHVETWLANPHRAQMLVVKYEDLRRDPIRELRRFCQFAGVDRDDRHLDYVARKASFLTMRLKEQHQGIGIIGFPRDRSFVRRGHVGSYKDEMPADVLAAFMQDAGNTLRTLGYV